jgi:hypothetical protein
MQEQAGNSGLAQSTACANGEKWCRIIDLVVLRLQWLDLAGRQGFEPR